MGMAGQGRFTYIAGRKSPLAETDSLWETWFFEDNHVMMWIVNFVSRS